MSAMIKASPASKIAGARQLRKAAGKQLPVAAAPSAKTHGRNAPGPVVAMAATPVAQAGAAGDGTTYGNLAKEGQRRTQQYSKRKIFVQAVIAGCFIGFGGTLCSTVGGAALDLSPGVQRFLFGAIGFPLSIFLCTITDASASTANLALFATALVERREATTQTLSERIWRTSYRWVVSWFGNFLGLMFIAALVAAAGMDAVPGAAYVAQHKLEATWLQTFLKGVGGGWLITLAVVCGSAANTVSGKFVGIWLCISTYVMCGWEHGLANIFFFPCALFAGVADGFTWGDFVYRSLIPATLGNVVGGTLLSGGLFSAIQGTWLFRPSSPLPKAMEQRVNKVASPADDGTAPFRWTQTVYAA